MQASNLNLKKDPELFRN